MGGENELTVNNKSCGDEDSCAKHPVLNPIEALQSEDRRHLEKRARSDSIWVNKATETCLGGGAVDIFHAKLGPNLAL